jgi:RNA polymerase sigma-70 factor (ECF subfamily)
MLHAQTEFNDAPPGETLQQREGFSTDRWARRNAEAVASRMQTDRSRHLRYLRNRLPSVEDAEDALQDATIKFLQSGEALASVQHPDAWVGVSLRRIVVDRYRRAAVQRRLADAIAVEPVNAASDDDDELVMPMECVKAAVETLHSDYAAVLRQVYLEEKPLKTVAAQLDVTANNAAVRLHRARGALREIMRSRCKACPLADCWGRERLAAA